MEDLNGRMEEPMSIIRFRPNIVVKGGRAFEEDQWAEVEMGQAGKFWLLSRSPRCQLPNVDVELGVKNKDLPYKALVWHFKMIRLTSRASIEGLTKDHR